MPSNVIVEARRQINLEQRSLVGRTAEGSEGLEDGGPLVRWQRHYVAIRYLRSHRPPTLPPCREPLLPAAPWVRDLP